MDIKNQSELLDIFFKEKVGELIIPLDKRIYIIEDIDCNGSISHKRTDCNDIIDTTSTMHDKLTLSDLLNCLDGILELKNSIMIMTTNHKEKLDPALIRPGRINLEVELSYLDKDSINDMIFYHYKKSINEKYLIDNVFVPAQLENLIFMSKDIFDLENKIELFLKNNNLE